MKHTLSGYVEPTAQKLAEKLGLELVDVELVKENTGKFLRFFIDKSVDEAERIARALASERQRMDENASLDSDE